MRLGIHRRTANEPNKIASANSSPFHAAISGSGLKFDRAQIAAIDALSTPARHGYYLWGDVGRGKSLISETYFATIPTDHKRRFHFHDFFRDLHAQITREREPLDRSLRRLIGNARAVFFDEFHVHDVADGVYLSATLKSLLDDGILVLATSNYAPEDLMPNPLYHEHFRPAINIIRTELDVVHLGEGQDYRLKLAAATRGFGTGTWRTQIPVADDTPAIELNAAGHIISARSIEDDTAVFTFRDLCAQPLGVSQYLWLAERLRTITLTAVPDLATVDRDPLARFANLIDVLYDRDIPLHVFAAGEPNRLVEASEPPRDAKRIASRLSTLKPA
ncbi:cell division protein ZapE [Arthrobacter sp. R1-13]